MTYLLDANIFIQAKNLHYGFDFCPAFWDWLEHENAADGRKKIKIPNACIGLNVKCMSPYEMLRTEKARFVLGEAAGSAG